MAWLIPPELLQTPQITEMTENFTKVTKYLAKFKETLKIVIGDNLISKISKNNIFCRFRLFKYVQTNKWKPGNAGNQQKAF